MIIFDYIFYRLYNLYASKEKHGSSTFTAGLFLSVLQLLLLYCIIMTIMIITDDAFSIREYLQEHKPYSRYAIVVVAIVLEVYNYLKYSKKEKRDVIWKQFRRHPLNKVIKPWMFLILGAFLFMLPILVDILIKSI